MSGIYFKILLQKKKKEGRKKWSIFKKILGGWIRIDVWDYCCSLFWNMFETFISFKKEKQYVIIAEDLGSTK